MELIKNLRVTQRKEITGERRTFEIVGMSLINISDKIESILLIYQEK